MNFRSDRLLRPPNGAKQRMGKAVINANDLVGVWSAGAGYYDTFSDERLVFKPDGTGRLEFLNPFFDTIYHFRWQIVSFGVLDLSGDRRLKRGRNPESSVEDIVAFHFPRTGFSITEEERPPSTGQQMLVLRINLRDPYPNELGLVSRDWTSFEEPQ